MGIWIGSAGLGYVISGISSFGIGHIHSSLDSWRLIFLIWGAITFAWGILLALLLPGSPVNAKFLSEDERVLAIIRVKSNNTGIENKHFKTKQFTEAMLDPKTWLLFLFAVTSNSPNGGLTTVSSLAMLENSHLIPNSFKDSSSRGWGSRRYRRPSSRCRPALYN